MKDTLEFSVSLTTQIVVSVVFISLFFFLYVSRVEEQVVTKQVDRLVTDFGGELKLFLDTDQRQELSEIFASLKADDMTQADEEMEQTNKKLFQNTAKLVGGVAVFAVVTVIVLGSVFGISWKSILLDTLFTLVVVALVEFSFLTFCVSNYRSLDENTLKYAVVHSLQIYRDS